MGDLKPCPFCGGAAHIGIVAEWRTYEARCGKCRAFAKDAATKERAAEQWNRRATPPEVTALVEALREIVDAHECGIRLWRPIENALAALAEWEAAQK